MSHKEKERKREELFEELRKRRDSPVVVEGKKDEEPLRRMGFTNVTTLHRGKSLYKVSSEIKEANGDSQVIILTDFDPEGDKLAEKLRENLRSVGCRTDGAGRRRLRKLFGLNKLTTVQGLTNLQRKHSGKV